MHSKNKLVVGITGMPGSGKSLVLKFLKKLGWLAVSSDGISHKLLDDKSIRKKILRKFPGCRKNNGRVNRQRLGKIVFCYPEKRKVLEKILHPLIIKKIRQEIGKFRRSRQAKYLAVEVPLLFEAGLEKLFDKIVMVDASEKIAFRRLKKTRNWDKKHFEKVRKSQFAPAIKRKMSDYVIKNFSDTPAELFPEVKNFQRAVETAVFNKTIPGTYMK